MSAARVQKALLREAVSDAVRRRIVPAVAVVSLISLLAVDSCTSCASNAVVQSGDTVLDTDLAGWTGLIAFVVLGLWTMVLAGILASDHLAETLRDGSAVLSLSRPVSRSQFAWGRLGGVLVVSWGTGLVLLVGTAWLLHVRSDVALGPALWAGLACLGGCLVTASLAMAASLYLTRIATALAVLVFVAMIGSANAAEIFGAGTGALSFVLNRFAPPLGTSMALALTPWTNTEVSAAFPTATALRLVLWCAVSPGLLALAFRRYELDN